MSQPSHSHPKVAAACLALAVLAACGGGEGGGGLGAIAASNVTPLNGLWTSSQGDLQFIVAFDTALLNPKVDVDASYSGVDLCGGAQDLRGTVDDGKLSLYDKADAQKRPCLTGTFTDLRTLKATPTGQSQHTFTNNRVDVGLSVGLWVSDGGGQVKLKFTQPDSVDNNAVESVAGCDVSGGVAKAIAFSGEMNGFSVAPSMTIPTLKSPADDVLYSDMTFRSGAVMSALDAQKRPITLRRLPEPVATACP